MKKEIRFFVVIMETALTLCGCSGHKAATETAVPRRYERAPIKEVSEEQLQLDGRLIDALTLRETGHNDEALAALAQITADTPTAAAAWYEQGQLLLQRGWTDSALHCAQRAVDLQGDNLWYLLALAQVHAARGDARQLAQTWEHIVNQHPDVLDYHYQLSNARVAAGDLSGAVEALDAVERRIGVSEPLSLQKQRLWQAAGKQDRALRELENLADAMPHEKRYQAMLAQAYMQQQRYAKAKRCYDRILAADPDDEYIHLQLAEYYKQTNHPAEADSQLVLAFAHPRLDPRSKLQLLANFYNEEEFYTTHRDVSFRLLEQTMHEADDPAEFAVFYGDVLMRQQRYAEAADQLTIGLRRDSSQYAVWEALLVCLSSLPEREEEMDATARRAARLFPMHTLPLYLQGLHDARHERWAEALEPLERANKWGFSKGYLEAETVGLMAEAYYRTAQYDRAWAAFERYLKLRPDDWGTMNNYAYYLGEQGQRLEQALEMSRRTVEAQPDNANSLDTYAWLLHLLGRDAEALPYARRAAALDPESDTLQRHLKTIEAQ